MSKKAKPKPEVHEYQAEMQKLLEILVHSLYTEREIFLRELVSNASDALSKVQLTTLTEEKVLDKDAELQVTISLDEEERKIVIEDSGCGMTKEELVENLGTIANSGTLKYLEQLKTENKSAEYLIGQLQSLIHISEPTRPERISYAVFCLKKKKIMNSPLYVNALKSAWIGTAIRKRS